MGTRGLVGFRLNKKYFGCYNHFDSYPSGLGQKVIDFIKEINEKDEWNIFIENLKKVKLVDEFNDKPTEKDVLEYMEYGDLEVNTRSFDNWYNLLRNIQYGDFLYEIHKGKLGHLIDGSDFIYDSVFCEYAYILDLDNLIIEFYGKGNWKSPQKNNPFGQEKNEDGYYPVPFTAKCSFNEIPDNWIEKYYEE